MALAPWFSEATVASGLTAHDVTTGVDGSGDVTAFVDGVGNCDATAVIPSAGVRRPRTQPPSLYRSREHSRDGQAVRELLACKRRVRASATGKRRRSS